MYTSKTYSNGWYYGEIIKDKGNRELRCWGKDYHFTERGEERCVYDKSKYLSKNKQC